MDTTSTHFVVIDGICRRSFSSFHRTTTQSIPARRPRFVHRYYTGIISVLLCAVWDRHAYSCLLSPAQPSSAQLQATGSVDGFCIRPWTAKSICSNRKHYYLDSTESGGRGSFKEGGGRWPQMQTTAPILPLQRILRSKFRRESPVHHRRPLWILLLL